MRAAVVLSVALGACALSPSSDAALREVPSQSTQAVVVRQEPGHPFSATVEAWQRDGDAWRAAMPTMRAVVGRSGIVRGADKREGDGGTPAGTHRVELAFGYEPKLATRLAYRQATADDWWIDEPKSPSYNRWVTGKPQVSAEAMRRDDDQYEVGCVIEWNTEAPVPGRGSAIFFHVWKEPTESTSGCVAVCESDARALLAWLDRAREPVFVICER